MKKTRCDAVKIESNNKNYMICPSLHVAPFISLYNIYKNLPYLKKLIDDTKGGVKAAVDFVGAENTIEYAFNGF